MRATMMKMPSLMIYGVPILLFDKNNKDDDVSLKEW